MEKLYEILKQMDESGSLPPTTEKVHTIREQLVVYINELIQHDFPRLVELLYRVDVNEKRLKELLASHKDTSSAALITDLLIERQLQKRTWRQAHTPNSDIPDNDRW
jgi:hypothetical protein